jgi:hypothetical protein
MAVFRFLFVLVALAAGALGWLTSLPVNGGADIVTVWLLVIAAVALIAAALAGNAR